MKSSSSLQKHKKVGFKRPVPIVHIEEVSNQDTDDEKEITDIDSTSISSPEEMQTSSPILNSIPKQEKQKFIHFDLPINLENEKTIPEPAPDLFECSFNWITESNFEAQQGSDCDELYFSQMNYTNII